MYIISDIHGNIKSLKALLSKLDQNKKIVSVGDLIDRGPNSREVIKYVQEKNIEVVLGNHELFMINSEKKIDNIWLNTCNGGNTTIESYKEEGIFNKKAFLKDIEFLKTLPVFRIYSFKEKDLIVSHSCIKNFWKGRNLKNYDKKTIEDIVWNRHILYKKLCEGNIEGENNLFNIFGHTIIDEPIIKDNLAAIDTGAARMNKLTAIEFPSLKKTYQKIID
jgi:serine/threonine protein phosphatase 1